MPGAVPDTVVMITFLPLTSDVTSKHRVESAVALVLVAFWKTVICRDVERECLNLLQVLVGERLKHVDFVRLCPKSQESGTPRVHELGQGAVAAKVDRPEVVDIVDRGVLGFLPGRIVDHTKYHTTSEKST